MTHNWTFLGHSLITETDVPIQIAFELLYTTPSPTKYVQIAYKSHYIHWFPNSKLPREIWRQIPNKSVYSDIDTIDTSITPVHITRVINTRGHYRVESQHWFRGWLCPNRATSHHLSRCWPRTMLPYYANANKKTFFLLKQPPTITISPLDLTTT